MPVRRRGSLPPKHECEIEVFNSICDVHTFGSYQTHPRHFAELDSVGRLSRLFAGAASLSPSDREQVETEEGWILGVTGEHRDRPTTSPTPPPSIGTTQGTTAGRTSRGATTRPGYENSNGQIVVRATGLPGTDHGQYIYVLRCRRCGHEYGANGSDIFQRRCPACQGGAPGLPF